ncbi:MAG: glycine oxidase ThiO [Acidimicrobiales bacterium]
MADVLVLGGGIIGLAVAWRLAGGGASVTVLDPSPGAGASNVAAGMIAPVTEAHYGEEPLLGLNLESAAAWPGFASELEQASGLPVGYDDSGTLAIAFDPSDKAALDELHRFQQKLGLESVPIPAARCRQIEPTLAPSIRGGLNVPFDHQVDPRLVTRALLAACRANGVTVVEAAATEIVLSAGAFTGVRTDSGDTITAGQGVLATGWQAGRVKGLPDHAVPPVRPVKGQILRLRLPASLPRPAQTIRAVVRGQSVYLVPRLGGDIVCGATSEELGADTTVTAGAVYALLRDAQAVLPMLSEAELTESAAGLRPGSPDNAAMIGPSVVDRLAVATGHYRHGILLTPVTAAMIAGLLSEGPSSGGSEWERWAVFDPRRFSGEVTKA